MQYKTLIEKIVFLKTDQEYKPRIITKYEVSKDAVVFQLVAGTESSWHYEFEFTEDLDSIKNKNAAGFGKR